MHCLKQAELHGIYYGDKGFTVGMEVMNIGKITKRSGKKGRTEGRSADKKIYKRKHTSFCSESTFLQFHGLFCLCCLLLFKCYHLKCQHNNNFRVIPINRIITIT